MENNTEETLKVLKSMKEAFNATAKYDKDVQAGNLTEEDVLEEPEYILYNQILDSSIDIFEREDIQAMIIQLGKIISPEASQLVAQLLSLICCISANNAIHFYDKISSTIISEKLNLIINSVNSNIADISTHEAVLETLNKKIGDIEKRLKIEDINKQIKN